MTREKLLFCWSGGKDSALALHEIQREGACDVAALLTTMSADFDRVCMHGVRRELLERQAASIGLPLELVHVPQSPSNAAYEEKMGAALKAYRDRGVTRVAFGDIFLADLRDYRDRNLARLGLRGLYPIWKRDSRSLIERFIADGFKAVVACVDLKVLDASFSGRMIDDAFLADLPPEIDPCGENGEFHTFVFDGPIFRRPIRFSLGERRTAEGFCYRDLVPESHVEAHI